MLAFFGAIGGTYVGHRLEEQRQSREMAHQWRLKVLDRRIELAERTTSIVNRFYVASMLASAIQTGKLRYPAATGESLPVSLSADEMLRVRMQLAELHAEFGSVVSLDNIYFGPRTRAATNAFTAYGARWWEAPGDVQNQLIAAVEDEMTAPPLEHMKKTD